jgi:hypothetical protein
VWRTQDWTIIATLNHGGGVRDIAFTDDGVHVATAGEEGTVRVWSVPEGVEVWRRRHSGSVNDVSFSRGGTYIASAGSDKVAWVGRWQADYLTRAACSSLGRNLTADEWNQYIGAERFQETCPGLPAGSTTSTTPNRVPSAIARFSNVLQTFMENESDGDVARSMQVLIAQGRAAAARGEYYRAVREFDELIALNLRLPKRPLGVLDPEVDARRFAVEFMLEDVSKLLERGRVREALEAVGTFQTDHQYLEVPVTLRNSICWQGALAGLSSVILDSCDEAVERADNNMKAYYQDSRGLARALTGNRDGAISDFRDFITWSKRNKVPPDTVAQRERWIRDLESGRNPFDQNTMDILKKESIAVP